MKTTTLIIILSILCSFHTKLTAQDITFTQWENFPIHFNPALTGDFDGILRINAKYRQLFDSRNIFDTRAGGASTDYKITQNKKRNFNVGFHTFTDDPKLLITSRTFNLTSSMMQTFGDPESAHHIFALGMSAGLRNLKVDVDELLFLGQPEYVKPTINTLDIAAGLTWKYVTKKQITVQLGTAFYHLNGANISLLEDGESKQRMLFNLHGEAEIPILFLDNISIVPSFLYRHQKPIHEFFYGSSFRFHSKQRANNYFQFGVFTRSYNSSFSPSYTYILSATAKLNAFLFGISFDRFRKTKLNVFEFSLAYIIWQ